MARKKFLGKLVKKELEIFKSVKNAGFFTYGEFFYTDDGSLLLNETLTIAGIREREVKNKVRYRKTDSIYSKKDKCISALFPITNLLHKTSSECDLIIDSISHSNIAFLVFKKIQTNRKWYCSYASDNLSEIIGYSSKDIRTQAISKEQILDRLIYGKDKEKIIKAIKEISSQKKKKLSIDYRIVLPTGEIRWIRSFIKVIEKDFDELMIHTFQDITPEKRIEYEKRKNYYLAVHDPLTGLFNRLYLISRLPRILEVHKKRNKHGGILFIDLDGFKKVNDTLGHSTGDKLLKSVAKRIKKSIRKGDIAVRFAGDEFVVVLPLLSEDRKRALEFAKEIAKSILSQVTSPFFLGSVQLSIGASIGVASFSGYSTEEELLHRVDHLMYKAKSLRGKRLFSEDEE
jgi:diguanylate cyclase (GGDEF)-like protein